jgi:hypothetical protein
MVDPKVMEIQDVQHVVAAPAIRINTFKHTRTSRSLAIWLRLRGAVLSMNNN